MSNGIDYGRGMTNIDRANGIRYGVISINALDEWAWESFEADYGEPTCPECGKNVIEYDNEAHNDYREHDSHECCDYACDHCKLIVGSDNAYADEPLGHYLDDGEYLASVDSDNDVFVTKSPYYTRAQFCSPCAPGACHLGNPCEDGEKVYCFSHDWFEGDKAPYPVYRVADDTEVPWKDAQAMPTVLGYVLTTADLRYIWIGGAIKRIEDANLFRCPRWTSADGPKNGLTKARSAAKALRACGLKLIATPITLPTR